MSRRSPGNKRAAEESAAPVQRAFSPALNGDRSAHRDSNGAPNRNQPAQTDGNTHTARRKPLAAHHSKLAPPPRREERSNLGRHSQGRAPCSKQGSPQSQLSPRWLFRRPTRRQHRPLQPNRRPGPAMLQNLSVPGPRPRHRIISSMFSYKAFVNVARFFVHLDTSASFSIAPAGSYPLGVFPSMQVPAAPPIRDSFSYLALDSHHALSKTRARSCGSLGVSPMLSCCFRR